MPRDPASQRVQGFLLKALAANASGETARALECTRDAARALADVLDGDSDAEGEVARVMAEPMGGDK